MNGVINGVLFCNIKKDEELNERISKRNIPSEELKPNISFRSVPTQRTILPIVNPSLNACVSLREFKPFEVDKIFNPGNAQAPWNGFARNIDIDSNLRNQFFALQKAPQSKFIPNSFSSLYEYPLAGNSYRSNSLSSINFKTDLEGIPEDLLGKNYFNNNSRNQRMNINLNKLC